jgi:ribosomal protein RSM22 (predicted rRNA methylase)
MPLVRNETLENAWEELLPTALGRRVEARALALMVARQSARYRGDAVNLAHGDSLAARALFWFPRDVHKCALPLHELLAAGAIVDRPLRVLDLGAGLGATSLGAVRALRGRRVVSHITAVDQDPQALTILKRVAAGAAKAGLLPTVEELVTETRDLSVHGWDRGLGEYDLVLAGLSFVELSRTLGDEHTRAMALASHLETALTHVASGGSLVVIEPATRDEARALQQAREVLLSRGVGVFAPCPHARACPMLASERDWCHEDLAAVSLPPWLVPIAREAGLRWEGLTFSYLTLRRDAVTLANALRGERVALRLLSPPIVSKGKVEVIVCGDVAGEHASTRIMELSRDAKRATGLTLEETTRGDVLVLAPEALAGEGKSARVTPGTWTRGAL